ncbi:MAG TPA: ribosome small subunit-dependent GTPase A [Thermomicrobiales bacterium]|nr:ribosome small subunit-dependent GTPase A [Thermomicrobiales bacterium]
MSRKARVESHAAAPSRGDATLGAIGAGQITGQGLPGVVVRAYGKYFDVRLRDEPRTLLSTLKGTLKRERRRTDLVAVGDRVSVIDVGEGEGQIEAVVARDRVLARLARHTRDVEQVILANPDQVLFLFAIKEPEPHRRMLDRFLVLAESQGLPALIGINKIDLVEGSDGERSDDIDHFLSDYRRIYPVFTFSVATGRGIDEVRKALDGKITAVAGPSGVGKSSLLNVLDPGGERGVGAISDATGKGRHTTTATQLYHIAPDTWVADTPGIRALAMHAVESESLDNYFPEFRAFLGECFYPDCTHVHEPGCAVRAAVKEGAVPRTRYESYVSLRAGDSED